MKDLTIIAGDFKSATIEVIFNTAKGREYCGVAVYVYSLNYKKSFLNLLLNEAESKAISFEIN
tara:strand:+ start:544 stop:732 length:189 start_codon:yes stop_codon:yes gene_type:complete